MWGNSYMSNPQQGTKVVFEGECSMKHEGQMFRSSKYCVLMSNGDFKVFDKESDYSQQREPHRLIRAGDDIEGEVTQDGKELSVSVPNIQRNFNIKLSNESDAQYWRECLTEVIQKKRMEKMQSVSSIPVSYSAISPGGMGGIGGIAPPVAAAVPRDATTIHIQKSVHVIINGYQDSLRSNAQMSQDQLQRIQWPAIGEAIENGIARLVAAKGSDGVIADETVVRVKALLKAQLLNVGFPNPSFITDGDNIISFDNTVRFMKQTANQAPGASPTAASTVSVSQSAVGQSSASSGYSAVPLVGAGLVVGGLTYNTMADPSQTRSYMVDTRPLVTSASSATSGGSSLSVPNISGVQSQVTGTMNQVGGQIYSGFGYGVNQASNAIGNISIPSVSSGSGGAPQMYVPTFNAGGYSSYATSTSNYASSIGGQVHSGIGSGVNQVTSAIGGMHISGNAINTAGSALAAASGFIVGAVTSDTTLKMLQGLGQLASNIPLLGVIGVSMKLFFDAAQLAKYNKKAAEALSARVREVGEILNELCATVTSPSATMNTQLQNLDGLINEIAKFLEKFQSKGYLSRLLSGSSDEASIKNFDKQLLDLIQLVQLTIGTKTIQLQQRTLQGMDEMNSLIKSTMDKKRAPGDSDETVMGKLSQEDIDRIAAAAGVSSEDLKSEISAKLDEIAASQRRMEASIDTLVALNGGGDSLSMANEKAKRFWEEYFETKVVSYDGFLEGFEEEFNKGNPMSQRVRDKVIRSIDIPNSSGRGDGNISYIEWKRFFRSIFADSKVDFSPSFDVIAYIEKNLQ